MAPPCSTVLMALYNSLVETPFNKYPEAPYFKALKMKSSSSKVVRTITLMSGYFSLTYLVQTVPSILGIRISIKIISGFSFLILSRTSCLLDTVEITLKFGLASRIIFKEFLINC